MAHQQIRSFSLVLQHSITPDDKEWSYQIPTLPSSTILNSHGLIKAITVVTNANIQQIELRLQDSALNRAICSEPLNQFLVISFSDFRLRVPKPPEIQGHGITQTVPATARESADYIVKLLQTGIVLNDIQYHFYGHSNSQLKSKSCFMFAGTKSQVSRKIEGLGDFSRMKTVAKKAKRIGLLFSVAQIVTSVDPKRCEDIPDIETNDYVFTDGCGLISPRFAQELARRVKISFRNIRYTPSVFQIRYRGYKGVVEVDPTMKGDKVLKFRKSMKKFSGGDNLSFSVVDYSKPYGFGYLNDEVLLLLHALGVETAVFLRKQAEHFQFLNEATQDPRAAFRFLTYSNKPDLAERVLMESLESVQPTVAKLVSAELAKTINKRDEQRCRILVPKSRLLFGVCDAWDVLKEGECAVKVTQDGDGQARALHGMDVLVTRNPCLHPGDLQKFKAVTRDELAHLVDCIIFPSRGRRPSADMLSGGDLDGDTFFVCWDSDLIPENLAQPAEYPGGREQISFKPISDQDRLEYFARSTNASLGRVKNLYLDWARLKGPMSAECQQLNRLFSNCVDGNRIKIPLSLDSPPKVSVDTNPFVLDTLHEAAKEFISSRQVNGPNIDGYDFDAVELLLSRDNMAISEFELIRLTHRWCQKNNSTLQDFLHFFDLNLLTAGEKAWILSQLPPTPEMMSLVANSLCQSSLVDYSELQPFKLHYSCLRWKCTFNSSQDRLARFLGCAARAIETFHRKFIIVRVDERLTLGIYIPQKIERAQEGQVDDRVRLFAFPHSQGTGTSQRLSLPTKKTYRLYCDSNVFQLFQGARGNTWIHLANAVSDDSSYRNAETERGRRHGRQETLDAGTNFDCRASVALDKFSQGLRKHIGSVNRAGILGAEIYVISNRDLKSMQTLDLWLQYVDTREVIPLFERQAREYNLPSLQGVDWSAQPDYIVQIAKDSIMSGLKDFDDTRFMGLFIWLLDRGENAKLLQCYKYLLLQFQARTLSEPKQEAAVRAMVGFLSKAPFLSVAFSAQDLWTSSSPEMCALLENLAVDILRAHVLAAREHQDFVLKPFQTVISQVKSMSLTAVAGLVELISLTIRLPELALDLLLETLEPQSNRLFHHSEPKSRHYIRNLIGIALDHISEATEAKIPRKDLLQLKLGLPDSSGFCIVDCQMRLDAPFGALSASDHVRLTVVGAPLNSGASSPFSMDALVEASQPGQASFRCFHSPPTYLEECSWELLNCGSFVTSKTMFDAVHALATNADECCLISRFLLDSPDDPDNITESIQKTSFDEIFSISTLNTSQNAAVRATILHPLTCLWGPPGTGKTYTIVQIIKQLQANSETQRILVTAPTHNAVDNVMRRYMNETKSERSTTIRVSTDVRKVAEDLRKYTCDAMLGKELNSNYSARNKARDQIKKARLIFTTCIGSGLGLLRSEKFDTVIIDEASQQTEPASLVPLTKGCRKAILVGDHVQLGATVQPYAILTSYEVSLFERLYTQAIPDDGIVLGLSKVMLDTQYRMHEDICKFSSDEFYGGKLLTGIPKSTRPVPESRFPWPSRDEAAQRTIFLECSSLEDLGRKSKSNAGQADACHTICKLLNALPLSGKEPSIAQDHTARPPFIAVLTPYSRQAELLKSKLSVFSNVEVSSIDGFQGREADIVIFVTVRCNMKGEIGFLKDLKRMNVALTRAKTGVIVVGNRSTLTTGTADPESTIVWKRLIAGLTEVKLASQ
ncbi:related to NAM7-nonsense-mediated mRNA decay protein (RdRP) [Rhynchosporium agropyri]|uniref:Related to NAM7-nonsense-mediated mRNA decay protein (RdRP) n=1 Tax=Rhynchosporium agropyri TaxID=914238 RepID=A0A1E1KLU3_9HELO|nr:related to NAM7-nonsense-mediated mRNA decay protein (RdRP) [Rhynchosporium agropyri]